MEPALVEEASSTDSASRFAQQESTSRTGNKKGARVASGFIKASKEEHNHRHLAKLRGFLKSFLVANFMLMVVLIDAYCTCVDIDATAANVETPEAFTLVSRICLVMYTLELTAFLGAFGLKPLCKDWMMILDVVIVCSGWAEEIVASMADGDIAFRTAVLRALRLVRIFRLMRSLKRVRALRELYKLAIMMATCFRALLWCFLLCFVVMTVWAMLMVELVSPFVKEMHADQGYFSACHPQCTRAVSTVMDANLLLFKTVIAGDAWGEVAVPVIQEHPLTAVIFVGSSLTLVFGVLNLIVAVVVDTFADARLNDVQSLAEEMEDEIEHDRRALGELFERMDKDGSGQLSLQELIEGARRDAGFQSRLRVMDIDEQDLENLFHMIDQDQSGTIEVSEFIGPLSRWAHDSKTAPRFIKYNMIQTMQLQEDLYSLSVAGFQQLAARVEEVSSQLQRLNPGLSKAAEAVSGSPGAPDEVALPCSDTRTELHELPSPGDAANPAVDNEIHQPRLSPQPVEFLAPAPFQKDLHERSAKLEAVLESAMSRLEAKLDLMLAEERARPRRASVGGDEVDVLVLEVGRKKKTKNNDAFQKMYMNHGSQFSPSHDPPVRAADEAGLRRRSRKMSSAEEDAPPKRASSVQKPSQS